MSSTSLDAVGPVVVADSSAIGEARRVGQRVASIVGLSEEDQGRLAIVVTEIATNQLRHGRGGTVLFQPLFDSGRNGVLIVATDRGAGMDVPHAMRDGFSSAGTAGNGLGAIQRLSDEVDIQSAHGRGTVVIARVAGKSVGDCGFGVSIPLAGEEVCGDAWAVALSGDYRTAILADGLGHGPSAADAARVAIEGFLKNHHAPIETILRLLHGLLRPTRGAAVAIARVDRRERTVRFGGVGNISGIVLGAADRRNLISHNGTLGHEARRFQEFVYPWSDDSILLMHSDGVLSQWRLDDLPGIQNRHAAIIASILIRDFSRGRDDATALVLKNTEPRG